MTLKNKLVLVLSSFIIFSAQAEILVPDDTYKGIDPRFLVGDKVDFADALKRHTVPLSQWVERLNNNSNSYNFICFGETHENRFRDFYADLIFAKLKVDELLIEEKPGRALEIVSRVKAGEESVNSSGADIAKVLRQFWTMNPNGVVEGVEMTDAQATMEYRESKIGRSKLSRDGFIAHNIAPKLEEDRRVVALYGASHCAKNDIGLNQRTSFYNLLRMTTPSDTIMHNVKVIFPNDNNLLKIYLNSFGLGDKDIVITSADKIPESAYNYRWDLKYFFNNYDTIIYLGSLQEPLDTPER